MASPMGRSRVVKGFRLFFEGRAEKKGGPKAHPQKPVKGSRRPYITSTWKQARGPGSRRRSGHSGPVAPLARTSHTAGRACLSRAFSRAPISKLTLFRLDEPEDETPLVPWPPPGGLPP